MCWAAIWVFLARSKLLWFILAAIDIVHHGIAPVFRETLSNMGSLEQVKFIMCFAYDNQDLLPYSSYCIAISSVAVAVRYRATSDSFEGVFGLLSFVKPDEMMEIRKCSEALYQKLGIYSHLLAGGHGE